MWQSERVFVFAERHFGDPAESTLLFLRGSESSAQARALLHCGPRHMARQAVRTFSTGGKVSPRLVGAAVALVGAVAVTAAVAGRGRMDSDAGEATQAAKKILYAAGAYAAASAQAGCPTITELIEAHSLDDDARVEDAWGNRFRIACDATGPRVLSAGPDGRLGTRDDLRFTR